MDSARTAHDLNDETLEREIEAVLAVDPPPEFLARVRTRIAREPVPVGWRSWRFAGAGALVAIVIMSFVIARREADSPSVLPSTPVLTTAIATAAPDVQATLRLPPAAGTIESAVPRAEPVERVIEGPQILIPPGEALALRALVTHVREGRIDAAVLDDAPLPEPIGTLAIDPIAIAPLSQLALQEGERSW